MTAKLNSKKYGVVTRFANGVVGAPLSNRATATQTVKFAQFQSARSEDGFWGGINFLNENAIASPLPDNNVRLGVCVSAGVLIKFAQHWNLQNLELGDLVSHLSLAPKEAIQLTTTRTERRTIERSREDSSQMESSFEKSVSDKESLNVAQTASSSKQWSVSASLGFTASATALLGPAQVSGSQSVSINATESGSSQTSVTKTSESIHEATAKAAESLKTQTKISVTTTTEVIDSTASSRVVVNPSDSQILHLWNYEVVKKFQVTTRPEKAMACLRIGIDPPNFDAVFVATQTDFLRGTLMDKGLLEKLPEAQAAAKQLIATQSVVGGAPEADYALLDGLLFSDNLQQVYASGGTSVQQPTFYDYASVVNKTATEIPLSALARGVAVNPWSESSNKSSLISVTTGGKVALEYREWAKAGMSDILLAWQALFAMRAVDHAAWSDTASRREKLRRFMGMCRSRDWRGGAASTLLGIGYSDAWHEESFKNEVGNMAGSVLARRIQTAMFLTTVGGESTDASLPTAAFADQGSAQELEALLVHLRLFRNIYCAAWLRWIEKLGGRTNLGFLINMVLAYIYGEHYEPSFAEGFVPFHNWYRLEDVVLNENELLVPVPDVPTDGFTSTQGGAGATGPLHHPAASPGDALINLAMSAWVFNNKLRSPDRRPKRSSADAGVGVSGLLATLSTQTTASAYLSGTTGIGAYPSIGGVAGAGGKALQKSPLGGGQLSGATQAELTHVGGLASGAVTPHTAAILSLGEPDEMEHTSSVETLASGVYVSGEFE